jgi:hypothetical protein
MKKLLFAFVLMFTAGISYANNILVQNVTTTGNNATNKTIQVQFDLSWDNSWRDAINWDAAWVFLKFKNASGVWQHAQLNTTGFANGSGTTNTVQVTSDKIGAWVYRSAQGSGTFNNTTMQLQWNYGLSGLTSVTGLEVRVFAVEMVYVPQGDFNVASIFYFSGNSNGSFNAPATKFPVINTKLTPTLTYNDGTSSSLRIKGDAGIDTDNNGTVDNTTYPIGYNAFYSYKYELTEQQYSDFLNTLTSTQRTTLGVAGSGISLSNGQYFSSTPNKACGNSTAMRLLAYADWSGVRPMSFLEFNKVSYGPLQPVYNNSCCPRPNGYAAWGTSNSKPTNFVVLNSACSNIANVGYAGSSNSTRQSSGASYYGVLDLSGNVVEPVVKLNYSSFTTTNGNGVLASNGATDVSTWNSTGMLVFIDMTEPGAYNNQISPGYGFRYVRSAE